MLTGLTHALEALRISLTHAQQHNGQMVLVTGGLAAGKTTLLQQFAGIAALSATVLYACGSYAERNLRMGIVWQLLHGSPLSAEAHERVGHLMGLGDDDGTDHRTDDALFMHGIGSLLLESARDRPLVVIVDDLQFADTASVQVLQFLQRRLRPSGVLLVVSSWDQPGLLGPVVHSELTRHPDRRLQLRPLSTEDIGKLVPAPQITDTEPGADLAGELHALSGGNPLLFEALLEDNPWIGLETGHAGERVVAGESFRRAVLDCLHRWDPTVLEVARGLAVFGRFATAELVGRLIDRTPSAVGQVLTILTRCGMAHDGKLRRHEVGEVILETMPAERTVDWHLIAADLLYQCGTQAVDIAWHLVRADRIPGPWAIKVLRLAADQALADNDVDFATRSLELGLRECDQQTTALDFRAALVRLAWRVNPSAGARHIGPLHDALRAGQLAATDAVPLIRYLLWQGDRDVAAEQLREIADAPGHQNTQVLRQLHLAHEFLYGRPWEDAGADAATVRPAEHAIGADFRPSGRLSLIDLWQNGPGNGELNTAEHILQGRLTEALPEVGALALLVLDHAGQHKQASHWHRALTVEADRLNAPTWQAVLAAVGADMAMRRGDMARAAKLARLSLDHMHPQSWGVAVGFPLATLVLAETALGRMDEAAAALEVMVPDQAFDTLSGLVYLHARGQHNLAAGRILTASHDFERCGALMREWNLDLPALVPWRGALAQAHLRLGQARKAGELLVAQIDRLRTGDCARVRGTSLRLLAAAAPTRKRPAMLQEAARLLERSGDRLELARALTDITQLHTELGDLQRARMVARRAAQEAKACNSEAMAPSAITATKPEPPAEEDTRTPLSEAMMALSEAERKVATLAAVGHTNREIGRKLYVTVSTVEQHLTRVYRKLNVRQRVDLPSALVRQGCDLRL